MQQPPTKQSGGSSGAILDLVKVLYEPGTVFQRVGEKPKFLMPFLVLAVLMLILSFSLKPFFEAGLQASMAQAAARLTPEQAARMPSAAAQAKIVVFILPLYLLLTLLIGAGLLWVTVSITGGEAKYRTLLSVLTYSCVTYVAFTAVTALVLHVRGVESVASMEDVRAQLGLDLLAPNAGRFLSAFLSGFNPLAVWGVWLTATGISITSRVSRGSGYVAAGIAYVIGLFLLSVLSLLQQG